MRDASHSQFTFNASEMFCQDSAFFREIYIYWKDIIVFNITNFMKIMISEIKNAAAHNEKGVQPWDLRSIGYIVQESKILKIPRQMVCPRSKVSRIQRKSVWAGSKIFRICRQNVAVGSKIFRVFRQNVSIESKIFKIFRQNVSIGSKIFKIFRQNVAIGSKIFKIHRSWIFRIQDPGSFWDLGTSLFGSVSSKSFESRLAHLSTTIRFRDRRGIGSDPPPPQTVLGTETAMAMAG